MTDKMSVPEPPADGSGYLSDEGEEPLHTAMGIACAVAVSAGLWGLMATVWWVG
jgi:hypothetical protein